VGGQGFESLLLILRGQPYTYLRIGRQLLVGLRSVMILSASPETTSYDVVYKALRAWSARRMALRVAHSSCADHAGLRAALFCKVLDKENEVSSQTMRLKVANVCYANIASRFAMFMNEKYRGPNFTWESFIENCVEMSSTWVYLTGEYDVSNVKVKELAEQYAREIATRLVSILHE
jgi:hypothetical protein